MKKTLLDFRLDGARALEYVLAASPYGGVDQAVASMALFSHPATVAQAGGRSLFRIIRGPIPQRGQLVGYRDGGKVLLDDNTGPTDAFLWANKVKRGSYSDIQFCHIWQASEDVTAYTNLANVCVLPAFLAKLSDTHPRIVLMLKWRAEKLYSWRPAGTSSVPDDPSFGELAWAPTLEPVTGLEQVLRSELRTKPKSRTTISARQIGWAFSAGLPDESLPAAS